jgi:hypothetical protein
LSPRQEGCTYDLSALFADRLAGYPIFGLAVEVPIILNVTRIVSAPAVPNCILSYFPENGQLIVLRDGCDSMTYLFKDFVCHDALGWPHSFFVRAKK